MLRVSSRELGDEVEISVLDADYGLKQVSVTVSEVEVPLINHYVVTAEDSASVSIVRIKRFYEDVYRDFMQALEDQKTMGYNATHLIIDLRDNPGGIVEETVKILNQLIPEKQKLLLSTNKKSGRAKEYLSNGRTFLDIERIVIICNEASASASEILAGVLQDYDRGVVIGLPSYGKGLIQQNYDLSNDGSINLSIGEYILPSGRHIHPSSMTDSTYQSLVNTRSLSAGRGVPPDVLLEDCVMRLALGDHAKQLTIRHDLWTKEDLSSEDRRSIITSDILSNENCVEARGRQLWWEIVSATLEPGDQVDLTDLDTALSLASELILSDRYLSLLGY